MSNALVELWRRELDGMAKSAIRSIYIYDVNLAVDVAQEAIRRGCTPSEILEALYEAKRVHG